MFCEILTGENIMINAINYSNFLNFLPLILAFVVLGLSSKQKEKTEACKVIYLSEYKK